jgi:amino-acid N-acetyltransferase
MEEVAEATAIAIRADKLVFLTDSPGVTDGSGNLLDELTVDAAERLMRESDWLSHDLRRYLPCAVRASRSSVGRVHLISYNEEGTLLLELFSRDGVGTIITRESLEILRDARADDISGLVALIQPLEESGALVRRSRELLEREILRFSVVEHDGLIVGCAALYPYGNDHAELACLAVHPQYRRWGYGEQLMRRIETRARAVGIKQLFVLTTLTAHWFRERGFVEKTLDELPEEKRLVYNLQRRSKIFAKTL